jgi:endonuclease-3
MQKKIINQIFSRFEQHCSQPKTELEFDSPFTLLVAIVLSAQSTDKGVNKATNKLFKIAKTPEQILELGEDTLKSYIKTIGLFNTKAKNIINLSKILIEQYNSIIPQDVESLQKLPGVGRKTANVFLNCAYNMPTIGVDTHVFRVSNRIGIVNASNVIECENKLNQDIDNKWKKYAHHWMILHGRYICKAKNPICNECYINDLCSWPHKTSTLFTKYPL